MIDNPYQAAEPGVAVGVQVSRGEYVTVMAADNRMRGENFVERMLAPFDDPDVVAAFPRVVSTVDDGFVNRYINRYSDPFNHFIYGSSSTSIDLMLRQGRRLLQPTVARQHPLLAIAQGCTVRAGLIYQGSPKDADDVLSVIDLVESGGKIALVEGAELEHHHVDGLGMLYRKYRRRTAAAFRGQSGYLRREPRMARWRRMKRWLWVPYSASLVAPALHGGWMAVRHRDPTLLYHAVVNATVFAAVCHAAVDSRLGQDRAG